MNKISWIVIGIILLAASYIAISNYLFHRNLISNAIRSKITMVEYKGRGGYIYHFGESSFSGDYFSMDRDTKYMNVGDSIVKAENSATLFIYKKGRDHTYSFYKKFAGK